MMNAVTQTALVLFLALPAFALDFPEPRGYVNDFAGVLEGGDAARLESELRSLESAKGVQMAVVSVQDLQGADAETYASELYKAWGIGKKGSDKGVLFLLALQERKARIEPGYGLEGVLPDGLCGRILREHSVPHFKEGRWSQGIVAGTEAVIRRLSGEASAAPDDEGGASPAVLVLIIVCVVVLLVLQHRFGGPSKGWRRRSRYDGGWGGGGGWSGGGGFGGFSGGGGFGGFGGGSSGGGGATASW